MPACASAPLATPRSCAEPGGTDLLAPCPSVPLRDQTPPRSPPRPAPGRSAALQAEGGWICPKAFGRLPLDVTRPEQNPNLPQTAFGGERLRQSPAQLISSADPGGAFGQAMALALEQAWAAAGLGASAIVCLTQRPTPQTPPAGGSQQPAGPNAALVPPPSITLASTTTAALASNSGEDPAATVASRTPALTGPACPFDQTPGTTPSTSQAAAHTMPARSHPLQLGPRPTARALDGNREWLTALVEPAPQLAASAATAQPGHALEPTMDELALAQVPVPGLASRVKGSSLSGMTTPADTEAAHPNWQTHGQGHPGAETPTRLPSAVWQGLVPGPAALSPDAHAKFCGWGSSASANPLAMNPLEPGQADTAPGARAPAAKAWGSEAGAVPIHDGTAPRVAVEKPPDAHRPAAGQTSPAPGISTAQTAPRLSSQEQMADSAAKFDRERLPEARQAGAWALTAREADAQSSRRTVHAAAEAVPASSVLPSCASPAPLSAAQSDSATQAAASRCSGIDLLQARIINLLAEVKRLNPDTLSVRLHPDADTALHLHLRLQQGQVGVEARLERGDFDLWQARWPELQQRLATQGIQLSDLQWAAATDRRPSETAAALPFSTSAGAAPLTGGPTPGDPAGAGGQGSAHPHRPPPEPEPTPAAQQLGGRAEPVKASTAKAALKNHRPRGWEWWA